MIITLAALSHSFFEYVALDARREGGLLSMHAHATFPHDGIVLRQSDTSMSKSRREVGPLSGRIVHVLSLLLHLLLGLEARGFFAVDGLGGGRVVGAHRPEGLLTFKVFLWRRGR